MEVFYILYQRRTNQALRIAHIVAPWFSVPPASYGGTENAVYTLNEALIEKGQSTTLYASGDSKSSGQLKSFFSTSLSKRGVVWSNTGPAKQHLRQSFEDAIRPTVDGSYKFDIIHFHLSSAADIVVFELAARSPIPVICTLHSRFPFDRRPQHWAEEDRFYLSWSDHLPLVAISPTARLDAIKSAPGQLRFVDTIPHALPTAAFYDGKGPERDAVVWFGRIVAEKGTHIVLEAALKAGEKAIIAGLVDQNLKEESVDYFAVKVKPLLEQYPDQLSFMGEVDFDQRCALLKRAKVFLNPIEWEEPFGLVMIEAMAQGCAVISFARGAAKTLILPGFNGSFATDVDDMAGQIKTVAQQMNRQAMLEWAQENFCAATMAERYLATYHAVIHAFQARSAASLLTSALLSL